MERQYKIPYSTSYLNKLRIKHGFISVKTNRLPSPFNNNTHSSVNYLGQIPFYLNRKVYHSPNSSGIQSFKNDHVDLYPFSNLSFDSNLSYSKQYKTKDNIYQRDSYCLKNYLNESIRNQATPVESNKNTRDVLDYAEYLLCKLSSLNKDNFDLGAIYSKIERHSSAIQGENDQLIELISQIRDQNTLAKSQQSSIKENTTEASKSVLFEKDKEIEQLATQIKQIETLNNNTQSTLKEYEELINKNKENISQLSKEIACKRTGKKTELSKDESIKTQMEEVNSNHFILKNENTKKETELTELLQNKQKIEAMAEILQGDYNLATKDLKQYEDWINEKDNEITKLSKINETKNGNKTINYKELFEQITNKNDELKTISDEVHSSIQGLMKSRQLMQQEYEQTIKSIKKVLTDSATQCSEMDKIIQENAELKVTHDNLIKKIEALPNLNKTFGNLIEENKQLRSKYNEIYQKEHEQDEEHQEEEDQQQEQEDQEEEDNVRQKDEETKTK